MIFTKQEIRSDERSNDRWYIWKINEPMVFIGELTEQYKDVKMVFVQTLIATN